MSACGVRWAVSSSQFPSSQFPVSSSQFPVPSFRSSVLGLRRQHVVKPTHEEIGVLAGERHRRADLQDVFERAIGADQDAAVAEGVDNVGGLGGSGLEGLSVADQFDADEEAGAAYVADQRVPVRQRAKAGEQMVADLARVRLQAL